MANQNFTLNIKALFDASSVKAGVNEIQSSLKSLKLPDNLDKNLKSSFVNVEKALTDFETRAAKGVKTKADAKGLTGSMDKVVSEFTKLSTIIDKVRSEIGNTADLSQIIKLNDQDIQKIRDLEKEAAKLKQELGEINTSKVKDLQNILNQIKGEKTKGKVTEAIELFKQGDIEKSIQLLEELKTKQEQLQKGAANRTGSIDSNIQQIDNLITTIGNAATETQGKTERLKQITQEQGEIARQAFDKTVQGVNQAGQAVNNYGNQVQSASGAINDLANNQARFNTELDQVKSRIQYFLGLANSINLIKRAIRGAFNTVKDLDKAMTETAVVTEHTISDMWAKLPEYTERANKLGVSTLDAYKSATLYYQQGLDDEQAAALSTETLKMARIAGLDAAEATDRMTNALRGFNMALDEQSAQRVDDVYSQLAAHTASNVDEISTAMTKVASLAHNANMEFETTAAFLAQIIETTRESAETAGTALKTVVARFSEVKKLVDEGTLKGTDEEGQVIDVNKVGAALRTAGIDLNKYFLGEVGLDDIFMELASKWDNLTAVQQRYIATQAAGSRQQSRFIALMQDYARTQDLVGMAYNAEGASAEQFEKTQDSLQSKLARLKNAWNEFLMGITNSAVIKTAVDGLRVLLDIINKITGAFGPAASGILKFGTAALAFSGLKRAFRNGGFAESILGSLGNTKLGTFLGLGGNTNTQITSAGVQFHGQVVSAGAEFAAAVNGASAANIVTGGTTNQALRLTPWQALQQFKANSKDPRTAILNEAYNVKLQQAWANSPAGRIGMATGASLPVVNPYQERVPKTLFGALGNKFYGTKLGTFARSSLAKLGVGGAAGAAGVSGAAALAATIGAITIAATAAAAAIKGIYDASPQGQLKNAQKLADSMKEVSNNAKSTANNFKKTQEQIKEYNTAVKEAGTVSERNQAIQDRNEYISSLLDQDTKYAQYIKSSHENGQLVLTLDESALEAATQEALKIAQYAQAGSIFAQATVAGRQANVYRSQRANLGNNRDIHAENAEYYNQLTNKQIQLSQKEAAERSKMEQYAKNAYAQLIDTDKVSDDVADLMSSILAQGFDETELETANWSFLRSRSYWRNEYLKAYGAEADENMQTADIARAVKQGQQTQVKTEQVDQLTGLLTGVNGAQYNSLLQAFSGTQSFDNLLDIQSEADIYKALGISIEDVDGQLQELSQATGISTQKLREQIVEQTKLQKQRRAEKLQGSLANLYQNGISKENLSRFLNLDEASKMIASELFSSLDSSFISENFVDSLISGLETGDKDLQNWLDQLDLSDPIAAFDELSDKAENGTDSIKTVAQSLLDAGKKSGEFSTTSQVTSFLLSESYESLNEEIGKFIEQNGEVDSSNILDLAESNDTLSKLLKNNVVTAKALATAVNGIESGTITVLDLNDAVLAALNSMDDLDSVVKRTIDDLNSFDAGFDENDITGFITKVLNNANENIDKGAYGNNVMANYMQKIFGNFDYNGPSEGYGEAYKSWLKNNVTWLEANKDNMKSAWSDFASTLDNQMLGAAEIYQKDGEIILNANGMTTQQLIDAMAATGKVTKTQAEMMVADFKNYSANFAHEMAENDLPNAIQGWMDALPKINGKKIYDESDISTFAALFGKEEAEIRDIINKLKKDNEEYQGIKWTNEKGQRTKDSILDAWSNIGANLKTTPQAYIGSQREDLGPELFDYGKIKQAYADAGIPQMFESDFNQILQAGDSFYANLFGDTKSINIEEGQTAGEAYAQAYQEAINQNLADKLGDTLGDKFETALKDIFTDTEIDIDTTKAVSSLQAATNAINDLKTAAEGVQHLTVDVEGLKEFFSGGDNKEQTATQINDTVGEIHALGAASNEVQDTAGKISSNIGQAAGEAENLTGAIEGSAAATQNLTEGFLQGAEAAATVDQRVEDIPKNPQVTVDVIYNEPNRPAPIESPQYVSVIYSPSGKTSQVATGGLVGSYAKGSENFHVKPGTALTGEEGPEIVWNKEKGYSYITGSDGPEFQDLKPGDRVFNASETKKILKNSSAANGGKVGSYAEGYGDAKASSKGKANGSDKKTSAEWKNELDWLYNLMENIVELERDQKKLEEEYEDILTDQAKTSKDLYSLLIERLGNLNAQLNRQTLALQKREQEMREFMDTTNDKDEYLWYNWNDRTIEIDWDKIEAIKDEEEYKHIKDLVSEAEEIQGKMDDAEDAIQDIENQIQELENIWRDTYVDFEKRVLDALVQSYQDVIDNYSELNETLSNTNDEILNAIQQEIDLERQIRDNTETEDDIAQKEARLAYLQRDTTGANATEILKLQEELENSRQDYEDTLVDQALQRLQEDNDAAAKQREKQIEIMQAQLDYSKENGEFNEQVAELLSGALSTEGTLLTTSDLYQLLTNQENWAAMSAVNKEIWEEELNKTFKEVGAYILKENAGDVFSTKIQEMTTSILERFDTLIGSKSQSAKKDSSSSSSSKSSGSSGSNSSKTSTKSTTPSTVEPKPNAMAKTTGGYEYDNPRTNSSPTAEALKKAAQAAQAITKTVKSITSSVGTKKNQRFATGGLNTNTGLAWLDGTPSEPEYVLNARQTQAFLKLADVLPNVMSSNTSINSALGGNIYLDLDMHVDEIGSDYDVDRIANRVKDIIYDASSYRNVNTINFIR